MSSQDCGGAPFENPSPLIRSSAKREAQKDSVADEGWNRAIFLNHCRERKRVLRREMRGDA